MIKTTCTLMRIDTSMKVQPGWAVRIPAETAARLPSKGMSMIRDTLNGTGFTLSIEPDGDRSHWFRVDDALLPPGDPTYGDALAVEFVCLQEWPEPTVPGDVAKALADRPDAPDAWHDITPAARWDWIRWIGAGVKAETRVKRIETAMEKLAKGKRPLLLQSQRPHAHQLPIPLGRRTGIQNRSAFPRKVQPALELPGRMIRIDLKGTTRE